MSFEVAAGVAGLLSLAIQATKELAKYYLAYSGQGDYISETLSGLHTIENILANLKSLVDGTELPNSVDASEIQGIVAALESQIRRLQQLVRDCWTAPAPKDALEKARLVKQRFLFPFRKGTIKDIHDIIREMRANITLALQVFNISVDIRNLNQGSQCLEKLNDVQAATSRTDEAILEIQSQRTADRKAVNVALGDLSRNVENIHGTVKAAHESVLLAGSHEISRHEVLLGETQRTRKAVASLESQISRITTSGSNAETQKIQSSTAMESAFSRMDQISDTSRFGLNEISGRLDRLYNIIDTMQYGGEPRREGRHPEARASANAVIQKVAGTPSLQRELCDTLSTIGRVMESNDLENDEPTNVLWTSTTAKSNSGSLSASDLSSERRCLCFRQTKRSQWSLNFRLLDLNRETVVNYRHHPNCPYFIRAETTRKISFSFHFLRAFLHQSVRVIWSWQTGPSGLSAGSFLLQKEFIRKELPTNAIGHMLHGNRIAQLDVDVAYAKICKMFRDGTASPIDVDSSGRDIFNNLFFYLRLKNPIIQQFVSSLIELGVPIINPEGPTEHLWYLAHSDLISDRLLTQIENKIDVEDNTLKTRYQAYNARRTFVLYRILFALMKKKWREGDLYFCSSPILAAIVSRSEAALTRLVGRSSMWIEYRCWANFNPLHLSCKWLRGLEILLEKGGKVLLEEVDDSGATPFEFCYGMGLHKSMKLMLDTSSQLLLSTCCGYELARRSQALAVENRGSGPEQHRLAIRALTRSREALRDLAKKRLPDIMYDSIGIDQDYKLDTVSERAYQALKALSCVVPGNLVFGLKNGGVYHALTSGDTGLPGIWEAAWEGGFTDIRTVDQAGATAFMVHATSFADPIRLAWIIQSGGVAIDYDNMFDTWEDVEDEHLPTSSQISLAAYLWYAMGNSWHWKWHDLHNTPFHDNCLCYCSSQGCSHAQYWMKGIIKYSPGPQIRQSLQWFGSIMKTLPPAQANNLAAELIRVLTFERFGSDFMGSLTHTCCEMDADISRLNRFRVAHDDIIELHDEEEFSIEKFKQLVAHLQSEYEAAGISLWGFFSGYWKPLMSAIEGGDVEWDEIYDVDWWGIGSDCQDVEGADTEDWIHYDDPYEAELDRQDWNSDWDSDWGSDQGYTEDEG